MICLADNTTTFSGPQRAARAEEWVAELPPGAAVHLGNGVVKILRTVASTGWVLAADAPKRRKVPAPVFVALFLCVFTSAGHAGGVGVPSTSVGAWAAFPPLAVTDTQMGAWLMALFAVCSGVGAVAGVFALFRPQPALHKQFADRVDHDNDVKDIKASIDSLKKEFVDWSSGHHAARRRMHKKINHLSTAMAYLAGTMERDQPNAAQRIRDLLTKADEESEDE